MGFVTDIRQSNQTILTHGMALDKKDATDVNFFSTGMVYIVRVVESA